MQFNRMAREIITIIIIIIIIKTKLKNTVYFKQREEQQQQRPKWRKRKEWHTMKTIHFRIHTTKLKRLRNVHGIMEKKAKHNANCLISVRTRPLSKVKLLSQLHRIAYKFFLFCSFYSIYPLFDSLSTLRQCRFESECFQLLLLLLPLWRHNFDGKLSVISYIFVCANQSAKAHTHTKWCNSIKGTTLGWRVQDYVRQAHRNGKIELVKI